MRSSGHGVFVGDTLWIERGDGRFRREGISGQSVAVDRRRRKIDPSPGAHPADLWIDRHRESVYFIASYGDHSSLFSMCDRSRSPDFLG